ncbi:hypothetical protein, partial [Okeania hirsuta]|uniref:hypothetical protein n=1 Tax=Okeania hirsuta TaxID=1458930 RepID=UPI001068A311
MRSSHRAIHRLIWQFSFTTSSIIVERFLELPKGVIEQVWAVLQEWSVEDLTRFQRDTFLMALYQSPQRSMVKDIADLPKLRRWLNDSGLNKALALPAAHYPSLDKELEKEKEL